MKIRMILRHAASECNEGGRSVSSASIPLSTAGRERAASAARGYDGPAPDLIAVSPYVRAEETARPFIERFPAARVESWPVYEFTFLRDEWYRGTTTTERGAAALEYWRKLEPERVDGPGAESFAAFLERMRGILERLAGTPEACVMVFSHETAMKAMMWLQANGPTVATRESMCRFRDFALSFEIPNLGRWMLPDDGRGGAAVGGGG